MARGQQISSRISHKTKVIIAVGSAGAGFGAPEIRLLVRLQGGEVAAGDGSGDRV
jgi:hypothetical protein